MNCEVRSPGFAVVAVKMLTDGRFDFFTKHLLEDYGFIEDTASLKNRKLICMAYQSKNENKYFFIEKPLDKFGEGVYTYIKIF